MNGQESLRRRGAKAPILAGIAACLVTLCFVERACAIPVFARKYQTSCITCHTVYPKLNDVGEAYRRNGFQFPTTEDVLVKEEPVKLGVESYKDMFPNSIWPSTLPGLPPISIFAQEQNIVNLQPHGQAKTWDFAFPSDIELIGAGTFGTDISALWNVGFSPDGGVGVGRVFVQFSNLFAWNPEEDEDGTHRGSRWAVLPPHALNLKIGKIDPGVLPHVISEETFPLAQFPAMPSNTFVLGQTGFALFAEQPAVELNGIIHQYCSYCVGFSNGGSAAFLPQDDNTFKDVYFRVARKWFGFPLDGVIGSAEPSAKGAAQAQAPDDSVYTKPGLDFWRAVSFETGVFGWFGKANIPNLPFINTNGVSYDPNDPATFNKDFFQRVGFDARLKYFDLDVYGMIFWGHDPFPGFLQNQIDPAGPTDHLGFFVQADYMCKPWIMAFLRYEQVKIFNSGLATFSPGISGGDEARVVPGVVFSIRQNLHLSSEVYIDVRGVDNFNTGYPEATCQWITTLSFAY
jgi:hypothetical protein